MGSRLTWVAVIAGIAAVLGAAITIAVFWNALGASQITLAGWLAMVFGVVATLALGIGLMSLVFISNRRGYDEGGDEDR